MENLIAVGCGGAGVKFLREIGVRVSLPLVGINDTSGDIRVDRGKLGMVDSVHGKMLPQVYPWLRSLSSERIFVIAGLGGEIGTNAAKLIGKYLRGKAFLVGLFAEPFRYESPERMKRVEDARKIIEETYDVVIYLPNEPLASYFSSLSMEELLRVHPVVMAHLIKDFRDIIFKNALNIQLCGKFGVGVGFGAGRERIRIAVDDALDSPWHFGTPKYAFVSGDVDREEVAVIMRNYDFEFWDFLSTKEYGESIKVTVLSK